MDTGFIYWSHWGTVRHGFHPSGMSGEYITDDFGNSVEVWDFPVAHYGDE